MILEGAMMMMATLVLTVCPPRIVLRRTVVCGQLHSQEPAEARGGCCGGGDGE